MAPDVDAVLIVSFGGPEGMDDVMPFLRNVTRGRGIPDERLATVARQYELFGGVSPLNASNRALVAALDELAEHGPALPVYWGNRNWDPYLRNAVAAMEADGVANAVAFATSAFSSYSSCRQYREDIAAAQAAVGPGAPEIRKLRPYFDHPGFIEPMAVNTLAALDAVPVELRAGARLVFTAHSIPVAMAAGCDYERQLREASRLVAERVRGDGAAWDLVFQSRSGPPGQAWLEPDILDHLTRLRADRCPAVVVVPIGFTSDHTEVRFDLDTQARARADELGLVMARAAAVGSDPAFTSMIRELVLEVATGDQPRRRLSTLPDPGWCSATCCPAPPRRAA